MSAKLVIWAVLLVIGGGGPNAPQAVSFDSEQSPLGRLQHVESISLGGKDRRTTVANICKYAFQTDKALRRLVIHCESPFDPRGGGILVR